MNHYFYKENSKQKENQRIVISQRFLDDQNNFIEWEIHPLNQLEHEEILKRFQGDSEGTSKEKYEELLLAESVVFPDLHNSKLQDSYGVLGCESLLSRMLTPGEYATLKKQVEELCMI